MDFTIFLNDQDNVQTICINNCYVSALKLLKGSSSLAGNGLQLEKFGLNFSSCLRAS